MSSTGGGIPGDKDPTDNFPIILIADPTGQELRITRGDLKAMCDALPSGGLKIAIGGYIASLPT